MPDTAIFPATLETRTLEVSRSAVTTELAPPVIVASSPLSPFSPFSPISPLGPVRERKKSASVPVFPWSNHTSKALFPSVPAVPLRSIVVKLVPSVYLRVKVPSLLLIVSRIPTPSSPPAPEPALRAYKAYGTLSNCVVPISIPSTFTLTKYVPAPQLIFKKLSAVDPLPIIIPSARPYLLVTTV